jgi:hypothetical protein
VLQVIAYVIALILLLLAAFGVSWRIQFGWLGLAVITFAAFLLPHIV